MNAHVPMAAAPLESVQAASLPTYNAYDLTKEGIQAQILLNNQTYFLRITRAGKLILTK